MKKIIFSILFVFSLSYGVIAGIDTDKAKGLPKFEGFKSNDQLQIKNFLKKEGFHKNAPYKVEIFCVNKKAKGNKMLSKLMGKKDNTVCEIKKIEGYAGKFPMRGDEKAN